ncbi:MAG: class I SAM-dependent methyltransferase [Acidobacteriia bacterium]|nr:class I SAM-dependent methyltransferase [Terriglobia bacterium]
MKMVLPRLMVSGGLRTALDVGCGALGFFSAVLSELELDVQGLDGRPENIEQAQRRNPQLRFIVKDIEDPELARTDPFDFVLCFGLLYHLENPFRAIRNLFALTRGCLLIETQVASSADTNCVLYQESRASNQALAYLAFIPTYNAYIHMLYQSGFAAVYESDRRPSHPQFESSVLRHRTRTILLAFRQASPADETVCRELGFRLIEPPLLRSADLRHWNTILGTILDSIRHPRAAGARAFSRLLARIPVKWVRQLCSSITPTPDLSRRPGWTLGASLCSHRPDWLLRRLLWKRLSPGHAFIATWHRGIRVHVIPGDETSAQLFISGYYDPNELSFLEETLRPGMVFIDVGANIGLYTLFAATLVESRGTVLALEPSRREFRHLSDNLRLNAAHNVRALPLAASHLSSVTELLVAEAAHAGHNTLGGFAYDNVAAEARQPVSTTTLDSLVQEQRLARVDVIKIDVEGHEWFVLQGARDTLARFRPVLLLEVCEPALARQGCSGEKIRALLAEQGYVLLGFDAVTGLPVPLVGESGANILAVPRQLADARAVPTAVTAPVAVR